MYSLDSTSSLELDLAAFELFEQFFADETIKDRKFANVEEINEADLRNALLVEAKRRKVWGAKAINKMVFENVEHSCCYHVSSFFLLFPVFVSYLTYLHFIFSNPYSMSWKVLRKLEVLLMEQKHTQSGSTLKIMVIH